MTDSHDRKDRRERSSEESGGSSDHITSAGNPSGSSSDEEGEDSIDEPLTVEEEFELSVDGSSEEVSESRSPRAAIETTPPQSAGGTTFTTTKRKEEISSSVSPSPDISSEVCQISAHPIEVTRIRGGIVEDTRERGRGSISRSELMEIGSRSLTVSKEIDRIDSKRSPSVISEVTIDKGNKILEELEEMDPVFGWSGGSPYAVDRPNLVLHIDEGDIPTFDFLQRCLRDTYAEVREGEPKVEQVDFVANEPKVPSINEKIVTLDLTEDDWSASTSGGRPKIERGGVDIVPTLVDVTQTLYSGGLGYFVVNLPGDWEGELRRSRFFSRVVEYITENSLPEDEETEDTGTLEKLRVAPVTVARPHTPDESVFKPRMSQYFGFESTPDWDTVAQADSAFMNLIRSERWAQVALTEKQAYGEESSRHYNWKGILAEGIARQLWVTKTEKEKRFSTFVEEELLGSNILETEVPVNGDDPEEASAISDIYLPNKEDYVSEAVEEFFEEWEFDFPLAIEFETGFSEGAFQYRKMMDSVEKYKETEVRSVLMIIPPRLLYRGERQARLLDRLVDSVEKELDMSTSLCVPLLSDGKCIGLRKAKQVTEALYDND